MHIEEDLDVVFLSRVQEPGDLVISTFSASNVGSVWLQGPVTDRDSDDLDLAIGHVLEGLLINPSVPMFSEDLVSFIGAKSLTEGVLVHTNTLGLSLAKEAVEERWGDPRLKNLPATDVGANHGAFASLLLGEGREGAKSCNSERFHLKLFIINK